MAGVKGMFMPSGKRKGEEGGQSQGAAYYIPAVSLSECQGKFLIYQGVAYQVGTMYSLDFIAMVKYKAANATQWCAILKGIDERFPLDKFDRWHCVLELLRKTRELPDGSCVPLLRLYESQKEAEAAIALRAMPVAASAA